MTSAIQRNLRGVRQNWRAFGPGYAGVALLALLSERFWVAPLETRLLEIEAEHGVLGPRLRSYRGHSVRENRDTWERWDWRQDAEDWTPSPEWKQAIIEQFLQPTMSSGGVILEVGPGGGRWSILLAEWADRLLLVDVARRTLDLCRERLDDAANVEYIQSTGADFPDVADGSVDRIWSFDVFVHIAPLDVGGYLMEMARVLKPGGVAVIDHSGTARRRAEEHGWRSPMTAKLFANLARQGGLTVERQVAGYDGSIIQAGDVVTILRR